MKKKMLLTGICLSIFMVSGGLYFASNQEEEQSKALGVIEKEPSIEDATSKFDESSEVVFESENKKILQDSKGNELVLTGDLSKFPKDLNVYGIVSDPSKKEVIEMDSANFVE